MSVDFDMKQLKRLPNGYKSKVIQTKKVFEKITENFRKSGKTFEENVAWLKSVTDKDGNEFIRTYTSIKVIAHIMCHLTLI